MTRALQVVIVNGSPSPRSKTGALAELVAQRMARLLPIEVHRVSVHALGPGFTGAVGRDEVSEEVEAELRRIETADVLIAATPAFRASYSGMFKHLFDLVGQYELAGTPVTLVATGGSDRHALVIDHAMRPLFAFFQADVLPVGVYAAAGSFEGLEVLDPEVYGRIEVGLDDALPRLRLLAAEAPVAATGSALP